NVRGDVLDYQGAESAARSLHLQLQSVKVSRADDFDRAFSAVTSGRAEALIVPTPNPITFSNRSRIVGFAQKNRLPTIYGYRELATLAASWPTGRNSRRLGAAPLRTWTRPSRARSPPISPSSSRPNSS